MSMIEFADFVGIDKMTVVSLESGRRTKPKTPAKITAAFAPYVEFVDPVDGVRGPGLILKPGFEAIVRDNSQGVATSVSRKGGLSSMAWDSDEFGFDEEPQQPTPPLDWSEDVRASQLAHWRAHPDKWGALAETSQQCLLRAMGVEEL